MTITKTSIEALKNCFLFRPSKERRKRFLRFQHGQITEIEDPTEDSKGLPAIYLRKTDEAEFKNLLRETEIELKRNRISGSSSLLAESVLVLNIAYRQTDTKLHLEQMIGQYQEVEATTFIGIPVMAVVMSGETTPFLLGIRVGRFIIGGHANYQHHLLFEKSTAERKDPGEPGIANAGAWILREPIACRVLSAAFDKSLASDVRDHHLGHLAVYLAETFKSDFAHDQAIPVALGAPAFETDALLELDHLRIDVAFGEHACTSQVLMNTRSQTIPADIAEIELKNQVLIEFLRDKPLESCPDVDRMLGTFSRFLMKAKAHETGSRTSDAFIHCVFALDLALGGKQDNTRNTTRRAAAIYAGASGVPFKSAEKELRALFDARSKYVHEGTEIPEQKFSFLLEVCSSVAECLLRARFSSAAMSKRFITEHWYPRLDLVVAAMDAGVELSSEHFRECGVKVPPVAVSKLDH